MKDRDFLIWMHVRLHEVYGESEIVDFMHKLRAIIKATDKNVTTPNTDISNSLEDLLLGDAQERSEKNTNHKASAGSEVPESGNLLSSAIAGKSDYSVAMECARRLKKEREATGKDTSTMSDIRRIKRDIYEGK